MSHAGWGLLVVGLRARERACTRCGSEHVRPSRLHTPLVARWLGLCLMRCETCWRRFLLPRGLAALDLAAESGQRSAPAA